MMMACLNSFVNAVTVLQGTVLSLRSGPTVALSTGSTAIPEDLLRIDQCPRAKSQAMANTSMLPYFRLSAWTERLQSHSDRQFVSYIVVGEF